MEWLFGIGLLFSALSSLMTNKTNRQISQDTNEANRRLTKEQNEWNRKQWEDTNEYNKPVNQVQRLREAGLSQAAAAQSIEGAGNASSLESTNLATDQVGLPVDFTNLLSGANIIGQMRELEALKQDKISTSIESQTAPAKVQGILTDTEAKDWALKTTIQNYNQEQSLFPYRLNSAEYKAKADSYLPELNRLGVKQAKMNYFKAKQDYDWTEKFNPEKLRELGEHIKQIIADAHKSNEEAKESQTRQGVNLATISNINADTARIGEETKGITLRNYGSFIENSLKKWGSPEGAAQKFTALVKEGVLNPKDIPDYLIACRGYVNSEGRFFNGNEQLRSVFIHELQPGIGENDKLYGRWSVVPQFLRKWQIGDNAYGPALYK